MQLAAPISFDAMRVSCWCWLIGCGETTQCCTHNTHFRCTCALLLTLYSMHIADHMLRHRAISVRFSVPSRSLRVCVDHDGLLGAKPISWAKDWWTHKDLLCIHCVLCCCRLLQHRTSQRQPVRVERQALQVSLYPPIITVCVSASSTSLTSNSQILSAFLLTNVFFDEALAPYYKRINC
jgi:hypothetical protein